MSFNVILYKTNKRNNSTKQPTGGTTYPCIIKTDLNVMNPTISLQLGLTNYPDFNLAYIPTFNRYYFIESWEFKNSLWNATMTVDVLASYKSSIGSATRYIVRSAVEWDLQVPDNNYPPLTTTEQYSDEKESPWTFNNITGGMYVVGILGESTVYYSFTPSGLQSFLNYLFSDDYIEELIGDWINLFPQAKAQSNPLQYISTIQWFPFINHETPVSSVKVGWVNVPVTAWRVGTGIYTGQLSYTLRRHNQEDRGKYLNTAPYTTYKAFFPPWGLIPLDSDVCANSTIIKQDYVVDLRTGHGTLIIRADDNVISWNHSQVGIPYQVSQVINQGSSILNLASPLVSMATGNYLGAIGGSIGAIGDAITGKIPSASTIGSQGGMNGLVGSPSMIYEFKPIAEEDLVDRGRPLCKRKQINTLSGYMVIADADSSIIGATKTEQDMINNFMKGGFYYE